MTKAILACVALAAGVFVGASGVCTEDESPLLRPSRASVHAPATHAFGASAMSVASTLDERQ